MEATQSPQYKERLENELSLASQSVSVIPQSEKDTTQVPQNPQPLIPPSANPISRSTHFSMIPLGEINLMWYVEGTQVIYEQDNYITKASHPMRTI